MSTLLGQIPLKVTAEARILTPNTFPGILNVKLAAL
jgi:hypothetical protein